MVITTLVRGADLLSQAEHGPDSQVILLSDDKRVVKEVIEEIDLQIEQLRKELAKQAMKTATILFKTLEECRASATSTHRSTLSWRPSSPPCWVDVVGADGLPGIAPAQATTQAEPTTHAANQRTCKSLQWGVAGQLCKEDRVPIHHRRGSA